MSCLGPNSRCSHPAAMAEDSPYGWPAGTLVTWHLDTSALPAGLTAGLVEQAIAAAVAAWPAVCGVQVARDDQAGDAPHVVIQFAPIDPALVVLGLTELPAAGVEQVTMQLNSQVAWSADELRKVSEHEFGPRSGSSTAYQT